ncbi:MAG: hypothetical protein ABJP34_11485 [Erythrobacter sp.]
MTARFAMILPAALLLAACESEPEVAAPAGDDANRGAVGEVLGGTISDEMIPYEDIKSQAPTMGDSGGEDSDASDEEESE